MFRTAQGVYISRDTAVLQKALNQTTTFGICIDSDPTVQAILSAGIFCNSVTFILKCIHCAISCWLGQLISFDLRKYIPIVTESNDNVTKNVEVPSEFKKSDVALHYSATFSSLFHCFFAFFLFWQNVGSFFW